MRSVLLVKFAALFTCIDLPAKHKTNFKYSNNSVFNIHQHLSNHIKNKYKLFTFGKASLNDLKKIRESSSQWKTKFILYPTKEAQEKMLSRKKQFSSNLLSILMTLTVLLSSTATHNPLGMKLDSKLSYERQL